MSTEKSSNTATPALHPVPVKAPWYHVSIDFVGPITTSDSGNCYILTRSDYCSKWVEDVPIPTKHASGVAPALFKVNIYVCNVIYAYHQTKCYFRCFLAYF